MRTQSVAIAVACFAVPMVANAGTFTTLHTFTGGRDGGLPSGPLAYHGRWLYGTTPFGGSGKGAVFRIDTATGKFDNFYAFKAGADGGFPLNGVIYQNGVLYGTTGGGGGSGCVVNGQPDGCGTIFSIDVKTRAETTLYEFSQDPNATPPAPGELLDIDGTLYGTTGDGGSSGYGSAFSFNLSTSAFATLYSFTGGTDGATPNSSLLYENGRLYGSTVYGGEGCAGFHGCGVVYSIDPAKGGETVLHFFASLKGGRSPESNFIYRGNALIGDTFIGGDTENYKRGEGVSFSIKTGNGTERVLDSFVKRNQNYSALTLAGDMVYMTLPVGGNSGQGELDQLDLKTGKQTTLYRFTGGDDGDNPQARLLYHDGILYGSTYNGGTPRGACDNRAGCGIIFKYVP